MMTREQYKEHKKQIESKIPPATPNADKQLFSRQGWSKFINSRWLTVVLVSIILVIGFIALHCGLNAKVTNDYMPTSHKTHISRSVKIKKHHSHHKQLHRHHLKHTSEINNNSANDSNNQSTTLNNVSAHNTNSTNTASTSTNSTSKQVTSLKTKPKVPTSNINLQSSPKPASRSTSMPTQRALTKNR